MAIRDGAIKPLGRGLISVLATPTTLYTAPGVLGVANSIVTLDGAWVANTDTVVRLVTIRIGVPSVGLGDTIFPAIPVQPSTAIFIDGQNWFDVMAAGWVFVAYADAANVVAVRLFGTEYT